MRNLFRNYYRRTTEEITLCWKEGFVVVDTSVLLRLYEYPETASNDLLSIFEKLPDRLWLPHQVGLEFHEGRLGAIRGQMERKIAVINGLQSAQKAIDNALGNLKKVPCFTDPGSLHEKSNQALKGIADEVEGLAKDYLNRCHNEEILERLTKLFDGKVGQAYDPKALENKVKDAEKRRKDLVPPGYADVEKKLKLQKEGKQVHPYGDYLIWFQILDKVKSDKIHIILVTADMKEDWWRLGLQEREVFGPRAELLNEFSGIAGTHLVMYTVDQFMAEASNRLGLKLDEDSVSSARRLLMMMEDMGLGSTFSLDPSYEHLLLLAEKARSGNASPEELRILIRHLPALLGAMPERSHMAAE